MENTKEKAQELIDKFTFEIGSFNAIQSALVLVDEILKGQYISIKLHEIEYWEEVKQEIEKL